MRESNRSESPSTTELVDAYRREHPRRRRKTRDPERSIRHSMARALRSLEADKKVMRYDVYGVTYWSLPIQRGKPKYSPERMATAYHEAGHAVIGLAKQLPITIATIHARGRLSGYVTGLTDRIAVGVVEKYDPRTGQYAVLGGSRAHDAFGHPIRERVVGEAEHHGEVCMCIAGGMAQMIHESGNPMKWRDHASPADVAIARNHRRKLGDKAKSWEAYEQETLTMLRTPLVWKMVEAVATALLKREILSGYDLDLICRTVVRRQHLKNVA